MDYPTGLWTTVYDMIDEDGQRVLFKRHESPDEPKYMLDYPFGCFTACVILEPTSDNMKNWKGTASCFLSEGCSDMFEQLVVEFDKTFAINGIDGETWRYDSKDFETNLYTSAKTACSEWLNKIKSWNVWYNKGVKKLSFSDMVKKQREKNLRKNLSSVGASYQLDYDRISNEMLDILVQSKQPNGDYDMDEYRAYEQWEKANYDIDIYDEYGDKDYDSKLLDMVEDKFIRYKKKFERELMDKVYDIQYNDLIAIAGRELYAKSTNGNDSYNGCKIWAGPDKDDDRGWYFDVSDFVRVIEPSYSGESIFRF